MDDHERGDAAPAGTGRPPFDDIAEAAAEYRRRMGQPELTAEEADALALDESKTVRRTRRDRLAGDGQ